MYITRVRVKDIRSIKSLDIEFQPGNKSKAGWTVFLGESATGKTTILQAIAAAILGPANALVMMDQPREFIRADRENGCTEVWLDGSPGEDGYVSQSANNGSVRLNVTWNTQSHASPSYSPRNKRDIVVTQFWEGAAFGAQPRGWCLAAYGATRRAATPTSFAGQLMSAPPRRSAAVTLFRPDASLYEPRFWAVDGSYYMRRRLLTALLSDGLLSRNGAYTKVDFPPGGHLTISLPEGKIPLGSLGAAYDSLGLLVIDIVRQMAAFYGDIFMGGPDWHPPNDGKNDGKIEVPHSGVVLIDDIDLHLDSTLRARIGPWLKAHFPRVQFIVTAGSLEACTAADAGGVFVFREPGVLEAVSKEDLQAVTGPRCLTRTSEHSPEDQSGKTRR